MAGKEVTLIHVASEFSTLPNQYKQTFFARLTSNPAALLDGAEQPPIVRWLQFRWRRATLESLSSPPT